MDKTTFGVGKLMVFKTVGCFLFLQGKQGAFLGTFMHGARQPLHPLANVTKADREKIANYFRCKFINSLSSRVESPPTTTAQN
jgi:hypothetical protein